MKQNQAITSAKHKEQRQSSEPIKIWNEYTWQTKSAGKSARVSHDCVWLRKWHVFSESVQRTYHWPWRPRSSSAARIPRRSLMYIKEKRVSEKAFVKRLVLRFYASAFSYPHSWRTISSRNSRLPILSLQRRQRITVITDCKKILNISQVALSLTRFLETETTFSTFQ